MRSQKSPNDEKFITPGTEKFYPPPRLEIPMVQLNPTNCIEDSFPMCSLFQFACTRTACSFLRYGCHRPANSFRQRRTRALLKPTVFALPKKYVKFLAFVFRFLLGCHPSRKSSDLCLTVLF